MFIYLRSQLIEDSSTLDNLVLANSERTVDNLIRLCLTEFADNVIYDAGTHAGYSVVAADTFLGLPTNDEFATERHPQYSLLVYLQCGPNRITPTIDDVEKTIEESIEFSFENGDCLNNFRSLENQGWTITGSDINVNSEVDEDGIFLNLEIPRTFSKGGFYFSVSDFTYTSNVNIPFYLDKSNDIIDRLDIRLINLEPGLRDMVFGGELSQEEALEEARNQVNDLFDEIRGELDGLNYEFFYVPSLGAPFECSVSPMLFLIRNKENNFKYIFGASL